MKKGFSLALLAILLVNIFAFLGAVTATPTGVYVDKISFSVISQDDQQIQALLDDNIDLIGNTINPDFFATLTGAEDIEVVTTMRNGYGNLIFNCIKYPFNFTAFRRAFAFAFDKEYIADSIWDGFAYPGDSPVPLVNPFSCEGLLPYTYYESNVALGNATLDAAGFLDIDADGYREAPDGSEVSVTIEVAQSSSIAIEIGQVAADAFNSLGIDASSVPTDFYDYLNRLYFHGDFDMVFLGQSFSNFDVDWLAYDYWSEYADEPYQNFPMFQNVTYDSWRDQLLHAVEYEGVYEAAFEMQEILVYECPVVICYENTYLSAYRTDRFEGHVNQVGVGVANWWTYYSVHQSSSGGTFRTGISLDVDSFNFMGSSSASSDLVNMEMWDSLLRTGPDGEDVFWLAQSYLAETHDDNPAVPVGYTRFTFDIVDNATWTDGTPLDAEDIAYTMNYYRDAPGNPYGVNLAEMTASYAPTSSSFVIEFASESYWHLHTFCYKPILPKHIFQVIGTSGWNTWNPSPPSQEMVTSGPFNVSYYAIGDFIELSRTSNYFRGVDISELESPYITPQDDISYIFGSVDNEIVWTVSDSNPDTYVIYRDANLIESDIWSNGTISIDVDGLTLGKHNFTIVISDTTGFSASDTVFVDVVLSTTNTGRIIFDYSHGQYNPNVYEYDQMLGDNLTAMGYDVVWTYGGLNETILSDADGLVIAPIYGTENGFTTAEADAIVNWYNSEPKLLWIGFDSDYAGYTYINDNMIQILSRIDSHVYGEPTGVEDPTENAGAAYRSIANGTTDSPFVSSIVEGVDYVLFHGPTCLYGSTAANPTAGTVSLEDTSINNVYPLLYYGAGATIVDGDSVPPIVHSDGQIGAFVACALETNAGSSGSGIVITSAESPYGGYRPMHIYEYYGRSLTGDRFVRQAIDFGMEHITDTSPPVILPPDDLVYDEGTTGNFIEWVAADHNPMSYSLFLDEALLHSGPWNSSSEIFSINVDGLSVAVHNYTLVLEDLMGHSATDTVLVEVVDEDAPLITHPSDVSYSEGSSGYKIQWQGTDNRPSSYKVYKNGFPFLSGSWNSSSDTITVDIDGLSLGQYNFTIILTDLGDFKTTDTVWVFVFDTTKPSINHIGDMQYTEGELGNILLWIPSDTHPLSYEIYRNSTILFSGLWNTTGEAIVLSVDDLSPGIYNYSIIVYDTSGNLDYDNVFVTVIASTNTATTTTSTTTTTTDSTWTTNDSSLPPVVQPDDIMRNIMFVFTIISVLTVIILVVYLIRLRS